MRHLLLSLMVLITGASSLAGQQDERPDLSRLTLEDLLNVRVVSASHLEEPADAAPSTVYVITSEEITRLGLRDLKDILALIPGVDAIDPHFFLLGGQPLEPLSSRPRSVTVSPVSGLSSGPSPSVFLTGRLIATIGAR